MMIADQPHKRRRMWVSTGLRESDVSWDAVDGVGIDYDHYM
jgi:hypothetical protein